MSTARATSADRIEEKAEQGNQCTIVPQMVQTGRGMRGFASRLEAIAMIIMTHFDPWAS